MPRTPAPPRAIIQEAREAAAGGGGERLRGMRETPLPPSLAAAVRGALLDLSPMIPLLPRPELVDGPTANSVSGGGGLNYARLLNVRVASLVL